MTTRPEILYGKTEKIRTGCGNFYITITLHNEKPFEVFARLGKAGGCASSQTEAIGRLASLLLRNGISPKSIAKQLKGISCHLPVHEGAKSCADAVGLCLEDNFKGNKLKEITK